jgi:VWFA-related protein
LLNNQSPVHNRRKAFIYVSNGYDFDPFSKSRAKEMNERYSSMLGRNNSDDGSDGSSNSSSEVNPFSKQGNQFAAADLASELSELTRQANRSNVTMYTIDPRGLVGGPDLDETKLDMMDWQDHVRETQSSLRVIADLTGGYAAVNSNDFDKALKRIDAETSDYYVLGYYSSNPDPLKKRRNIEIKVAKTGRYDLKYKTSYTLRPPPAVKSTSAK